METTDEQEWVPETSGARRSLGFRRGRDTKK